jgi:eukaryotic-like serine/threonine-protein kinase
MADEPERAPKPPDPDPAGREPTLIGRPELIDGLPKRTITQWKPPASATQSGLTPSISGERLMQGAQQAAAVSQEGLQAPANVPGGTELGYAKTEAPHTPQTMNALSMPPPAPIEIGGIIGGRYVIEQHISSGGFGAVYRASDQQISHHQVAIKLLHNPAASEQDKESALRELTLIASVSHPSVVQFKDYGWHDGRLWFAMPWYRGHTLAERLEGFQEPGVDPTPMKRSEAHPIFERIARGLAAMHDVGIYHHDIKPENVFLADIAGFSGGLPVLLDLGIAAKRGEKPKGLTLEYAAPETATAALGETPSQPIGAAADVFSLALVLRNALEPATKPTMTADNPLAILQSRANEPIAPPSSRDLKYLKPYFTRWLSLDPTERPTAAELGDQIAILIEPEERRKAQARLMRRLVPVILIAGGLVAALAFQLQRTESVVEAKETQIKETQDLLSKEQGERERIRRQSESQLKQLEKKNAAALGSERQRLDEAIGIARSLDQQLSRAERESDARQKRVERLTDERNTLAQENVALSAERDELTRRSASLTRERDSLLADRTRISAERAALESERDDLSRRADGLQRERDALSNDLATRKSELSLAKSELQRVERELADNRNERKELNRRVEELTRERDRIEAIRRALERQLANRPASGSTDTPSDPTPTQPDPDKPRPPTRPTVKPGQTGSSDWR